MDKSSVEVKKKKTKDISNIICIAQNLLFMIQDTRIHKIHQEILLRQVTLEPINLIWVLLDTMNHFCYFQDFLQSLAFNIFTVYWGIVLSAFILPVFVEVIDM